MSPLLSVSGLTKSFFIPNSSRLRVQAVRNVSFEIASGEILGLAGESGSGKTTLARMLLGLIQMDEGGIFYRGTNLTAMDKKSRRAVREKIQAIFQDPLASVNPLMRVEKIVSEPLIIRGGFRRGEIRNRVRELLEAVELPAEYSSRRPGQLSGGEQQRVCIARALALNPQLLIADEPVSALDAELRGGILTLLKKFRDRHGVSILLIAHDLSLFQGIADRLAILYGGEIVEIGKTEDVLLRPRHPYTEALLDAIPPYSRNELKQRNELRMEKRNPPKGNQCAYFPRCPRGDVCPLLGVPPEKKLETGFYRCYF